MTTDILHIPDNYVPASDLLKDRVILITGAAGGIGSCAAKTFAAHGATVILMGRKERPLEKIYDAIVEAGGPHPAIVPLNFEIASLDDYEDIARLIKDEFGRLDGLLHCAAYLGHLAPIELQKPKEWHKVMQVNLGAAFLLTRACLPLLKESEDASLLFTSDTVGRTGKAYWGAYGVSKFAIEGLMQTLAEELKSNTHVRVNSIDPGQVNTALRRLAYPGGSEDKLVAPEEIMNSYLYLIGPDSKGNFGRKFVAQY